MGNLESEERVVNDSHIANITSFLSTGHANLDSFFKNISKEVEGNLHLKQFVAFIKGEVPNPLKEEEEASLQRAEQVDSPSLEPRSQAESPADAVMRVIADQLSRIQFFRPPF